MRHWKIMILLAGLCALFILICTVTPEFLAIGWGDIKAQTTDMLAIPDSNALCLVSSENGVTIVRGYDPDKDSVIYSMPLGWKHDFCFAVGNKVTFARQNSQFDMQSSSFRFELQLITLDITNGEVESNISINNIQTSPGRVAVTEHRIAVIDNNDPDTLRLYDNSSTPISTLKTDYANLRIEACDGNFLFISHSESDNVYIVPLEAEEAYIQPPMLLSGVSKPVIAAENGLMFTDNGLYRYDALDKTTRPIIELPISMADLGVEHSCFVSNTSLYVLDNSTLELIHSSDADSGLIALCANRDGVWRLSRGSGAEDLLLLPMTDIVPPEPETISGDLYPVPDENAWKSVWEQAIQGLPAKSDELFSDVPSVQKPFHEGALRDGVSEKAASMLNICRTMAGMKPLNVELDASEQMQRGAVLLASDAAVMVNGRKPDGMSDSFYESGLEAIKQSNALLLEDKYPFDSLNSTFFYSTPVTAYSQLFSPGIGTLRMGIAPTNYGAAALLSFSECDNWSFDRQFYCWPVNGAFPVEYALPLSHWLVIPNPEELLIREEKLSAFITSARTGEVWESGINVQGNALTIAPPEDIREGDSYTLRIEGMERPDGTPVILTLQYDFFRLVRIFPESLSLYRRYTENGRENLMPLTGDLSMYEGETFTMVCYMLPGNTTETDLSITVDRPDILQVEKDGVITSLKAGDAVITVSAAGGLQIQLPVTVNQKIPQDMSGGINSRAYSIDRKAGFIYNIPPSITSAKFRSQLYGDGVISVKKPDGRSVTGTVGTGCIVELIREGQVVDRLTLLVFGDVTGEGNVNTRDVLAVRKHILRDTPLEEPYLRAGDTDHDGRISSLDMLMISRHFMGIDTIPSTETLPGLG